MKLSNSQVYSTSYITFCDFFLSLEYEEQLFDDKSIRGYAKVSLYAETGLMSFILCAMPYAPCAMQYPFSFELAQRASFATN